MCPQIEIFGHAVQSYYLCAALAALVGIGLASLTLRRESLGWRRFVLPLLVALAALVGARLLNFFLNPDAYGADFPVWTLSYRKLSLMGGLALGVLTVFVFAFAVKRSPFRLCDALTLPAGAGIVLLKLGCFLNGCCIAKATSGPLGMVFPANETLYDYIDTLPLLTGRIRTVYPTQLFELLGAALGLAVILPLCRRKTPPDGVKAVLYAAWFTLVRLAVHPLRIFPYDKHIVSTLYPAFYCIALAVLGVILAILLKNGRRKANVLQDLRNSDR